MTYQLFQVIARAKLVNFAILAALFRYNSVIIIPEAATYYSIKPSNNSIIQILPILKREQLCALITHYYHSDVENLCQ